MPHVVIAPQDIRNGAIVIRDPEVLHHLVTVLRVHEGDRVECLDGRGGWYAARVAATSRVELVLDIVEQGREPPPALSVRLMPALIKPERFDWLVQKTTELGIERISPVLTARSVVRLGGDRAEARLARWRRIAQGAAQQCGRATVPRIDVPMPLEKAISLLGSRLARPPGPPSAAQAGAGGTPGRAGEAQGSKEMVAVAPPSPILLATLTVPGRPLREVLAERPGITSAAVLIGPEGDFTEEEVVLARRHGAVPVSLGRRVLRSETAAVVMLAILQHTAGEL